MVKLPKGKNNHQLSPFKCHQDGAESTRAGKHGTGPNREGKETGGSRGDGQILEEGHVVGPLFDSQTARTRTFSE